MQYEYIEQPCFNQPGAISGAFRHYSDQGYEFVASMPIKVDTSQVQGSLTTAKAVPGGGYLLSDPNKDASADGTLLIFRRPVFEKKTPKAVAARMNGE